LAPFDPKKQLKKLKTWDQLPSDAELAEIESLMNRIIKMKTAVRKEMNGVQMMAYFHRIHIQLLKVRVSQMWNYSCLNDKSRTLEEDVPEETIQKQVRSLTKLTKTNRIPPCPAAPYSASKSLPKVCRVN
jgi:ribonucleotide reductase alpha subunit